MSPLQKTGISLLNLTMLSEAKAEMTNAVLNFMVLTWYPQLYAKKITDFCQIFEYHLHIMHACRASEKW